MSNDDTLCTSFGDLVLKLETHKLSDSCTLPPPEKPEWVTHSKNSVLMQTSAKNPQMYNNPSQLFRGSVGSVLMSVWGLAP